MTPLNRKDRNCCLVLAMILSAAILIIFRFRFLFGSEIDWASQHWVIPQYFRQLFYKTGELFPSFAPNLGAGQNIYYFAYYGLLSPWVFASYLLPFVPMKYCAIGAAIIAMYADIFLFYRWIRCKYDTSVAAVLTFLFIFSGPILFHSHRHLMFVTYMPFLLMALMGVDRYFRDGRRALLIISAFFLITTSFFFAVGSYLAILLYAAASAADTGERMSHRFFFRKTVSVGLCLALSALMAAVLLLPTAYALMTGRDSTTVDVSPLSFLPHIRADLLLYGSYTLGIGFLPFLAIVLQTVFGKRGKRLLSGCIFLLAFFPGFLFLLNGMMYFDGKALIPFLPIALLPAADLVNELFSGRVCLKRTVGGALILLLASALSPLLFRWEISGESKYIYPMVALECICFLLLLFVCQRKRISFRIAVVPVSVVMISTTLVMSLSDSLVPKKLAADADFGDVNELVSAVLEEDDGDYRFGNILNPRDTVNMVYNMRYYQASLYSSAHNEQYSRFYYDAFCNEVPFRNRALTAQSMNYLFNVYMGQKYLIADADAVLPGYAMMRRAGGIAVFRNLNARSVASVSRRLMGEAEYAALTYPANVEALMNYTVVPDAPPSGFCSSVQAEALPAEGNLPETVRRLPDGSFRINSKGGERFYLPLSREIKNEILFIRFRASNTVGNKSKDISVSVNGIRNLLTANDWKYHNGNTSFEYTVHADSDGISELFIELSGGEYGLSAFELYTVSADSVLPGEGDGGSFLLDRFATDGDILAGAVRTEEDAYLVTTVPYDRGFTVLVDGEEVPAGEVNTAFLGFRVPAGEHTVEVHFTAPGLRAGKWVSAFAGMVFLAILLLDGVRYRRRIHANA